MSALVFYMGGGNDFKRELLPEAARLDRARKMLNVT